MTYNNILCACCLLCVFASTVRFLGNNPAAGTFFGVGGWLVVSHRVTAVIASRKRPVPFRTRKLSSIAPMVLHSGGCGRVGRRRTSSLGVEECLNPLRVFASSTPFFMPATYAHADACSRSSRARSEASPTPGAAAGCSDGRGSSGVECFRHEGLLGAALRAPMHRTEGLRLPDD